MAIICKNCLVELEDDVKVCPLCNTSVKDQSIREGTRSYAADPRLNLRTKEKDLLQHILWQITATVLFSGIVATVIIDLIVDEKITWSLYPAVMCLIALSYASLFAFWHTSAVYQIIGGWFLSMCLLVVLRQIFSGAGWMTGLGIPLLIVANVTLIALLLAFKAVRRKSLNLLVYSFVAVAILCIGIEAITSRYFIGRIALEWSIIVAACLLPVIAVLVFMIYRRRNDPAIQKIFHT